MALTAARSAAAWSFTASTESWASPGGQKHAGRAHTHVLKGGVLTACRSCRGCLPCRPQAASTWRQTSIHSQLSVLSFRDHCTPLTQLFVLERLQRCGRLLLLAPLLLHALGRRRSLHRLGPLHDVVAQELAAPSTHAQSTAVVTGPPFGCSSLPDCWATTADVAELTSRCQPASARPAGGCSTAAPEPVALRGKRSHLLLLLPP